MCATDGGATARSLDNGGVCSGYKIVRHGIYTKALGFFVLAIASGDAFRY